MNSVNSVKVNQADDTTASDYSRFFLSVGSTQDLDSSDSLIHT